MIALWIILGLLALILVLMLIPAGLALHYHGEEFTVEGKWLFLRFTLWPLPEKEEPEKAEKKQEKKAIRDEHAIYAKGVDDGIEEGKAKGAREKQIEIAKSMLKENMDIEMIIKITGLTKQEIEKLQEM